MIELFLFGTPELRNGKGRHLHSVLAHAKHVAVLAYVTLGNGEAHRRSRLTALLWPDLDEVRARNALSKALHHLRRALGNDILTSEGNETLTVNSSALRCDVKSFESAAATGNHREALDLYSRGEFLEGLSLVDCEAFDLWVQQQRARLARMAHASAVALTDSAERDGDLRTAQRWMRLACEILPHDETAFQKFISLLIRSGNHTGALSAYQAFAQRMATDLDAAPSKATQSLLESIRVAESGSVAAGNGTRAVGETVMEQTSVANGFMSPRRYLVFAAVIAIVAVAGMSIYRKRVRADSAAVAVATLRNHTGNAKLSAFADLATGSIAQNLAQNAQVPVLDPGRRPEAGKLVTGDIYSKGDSLLVQMQIVSARDGHVIQQLDPVTSPAGNAYLLLDRLREGVTGAVAALADTLYLPWSTAHSRPPKYAAFQEFMQGLDAIVHTGVEPAVEHLQRAATLDTGFVEAKIWLLEEVSMLPGREAYVDSVSRAALAQRARLGPFDQVSLDRELAFLSGHWEAAYDASRRLVQIAPATPDARVYLAQSAMATRRYGEALDVIHGMDRSKGWLKDLSQLWQWDLQAHRLNRDVEGGVKEWRQLRARLPEDYAACAAGVPLLASSGRESDVDALIRECSAMHGAPALIDRPLEVAGRIYRREGFEPAARRAFQRALAIRSAAAARDPRRLRGVAVLDCELKDWQHAYDILKQVADTSDAADQTDLGIVAAHIGDTATVTNALHWIEAWGLRTHSTGQDKMDRGLIQLAAGDRAEALRLLQESLREGVAPAWNAWYVRYDLEPLRGDPKFEEMLAPRT